MERFGSSDVDFNDVFGGPPRRDWRCSFGGGGGGEEEVVGYRDPWTGLSENPVFGEGSLSRRRRQTTEFYDDIFRGDGSMDSNSTPKKVGSDVFSSTPPSRVLSPARPLPLPLPPQPDALLSSSLPLAFSLQGKLAKEIDFSPSASPHCSPQKNKGSDFIGHGSPNLSSSFTSRPSTHLFPGEDGLRNDSRPFYRQSSLSREFSFNSILSTKFNLLEENDREGLRKKKSVLSGNDSGNQFHFSIYKWASKGVPIAMLLQGRNGLRAKGSAKVMNAGTEEPAPCSKDIDLSSVGENSLEENESCKFNRELQSTSSVVGAKNEERTDSSENDKEVLVPLSQSKSATNLQRMALDTPSNILPISAKNETEAGFGAPLDEYTSRGTMRGKSILNKESHKPELKPLLELLNDDSTTPGNVNEVGKHRLKEGKAKSTLSSGQAVDGNEKVNIGAGSEKNLNLNKESNSSLQNSPAHSEEKLVSKKLRGKVKEFVKIFNEEAPVKSIKNVESGSQRFGVRERSVGKGGEEDASVGTTRGDTKERLTSSSSKVYHAPKDSARPPLNTNSKSCKIDDTFNGKEKSSISCSESTPESSAPGIGNMDKSDSADLFCEVEELPYEKEMEPQIPKTTTTTTKPQSQIAENQETIQDSDARIRQWSTGKEGNIRSLLSTMQYVLWPESGWKPVPLVDIIEGNSVKRAYQKALLCLHPDKLQQKGAAAHQKYIAEKVFDILQAWAPHLTKHHKQLKDKGVRPKRVLREAWTHFNLLGSS